MYLKVKDQIAFNKQLNYFFDTKHIYKKKDLNLEKKFKKINKNLYSYSSKKVKIISLTEYNQKNKIKSDYFKPLDDLYTFLKKNGLKEYFKYFLIHGSLADKKYVKGWSDVDTFVVIKNSVFKSKKKIFFLKKKIKYLYKFFYNICPLQHHGLIIFSEYDQNNYSKNYLPLEALKKNINLLDKKKKLKIFILKDKNELLINDIKNRIKLLKEAKKSGKYKHHPLNGKYLQFPLKENRKEMYQLFCHLGYMNTLPAYYLSCIGKPVNKKDSFVIFNKIFKQKKIKRLMKKSQKVRSLWQKKQDDVKNNFFIPKWIIDILGKNYLDECIYIFKSLIERIKIENEKK